MVYIAGRTGELVVTRYKEDLTWMLPLVHATWSAHVYVTGKVLPGLCLTSIESCNCSRVKNRGSEWAGFLHHLVTRHGSLAPLTVFLQGNPFTVSPDLSCLLANTAAFAPLQPLSWVQQKKRARPVFRCNVSFVAGCRVWIEPVSAGFRPLLHGDDYMTAFSISKKMKGRLLPFALAQLQPALLRTDADRRQSSWRRFNRSRFGEEIEAVRLPARMYRTYGSQFAASRQALRALPVHFYERTQRWLQTPPEQMASSGFDYYWHCFPPKHKAILLELAWMSLLSAERYVRFDVCKVCSEWEAKRGRNASACEAEYASGAPLVDRCVVEAHHDWCGPSMQCDMTRTQGCGTRKPRSKRKANRWTGHAWQTRNSTEATYCDPRA